MVCREVSADEIGILKKGDRYVSFRNRINLRLDGRDYKKKEESR